jgi:hypothetical protein
MSIQHVCSSCFGDNDLRAWVRSFNGPRGCDACDGFDSPTLDLDEICDYIKSCLAKLWGLAVEQLPYESAEGGYQGRTWDTAEVLFDEVCLDLPRDNGDLFGAMLVALDNDLWCGWDWLSLDVDEALGMSWERFCQTVKHERRFFFHQLGGRPDDRDAYSSVELLAAIAHRSEALGLIRALPAGKRLWRARRDIPPRKHVQPTDFGPPPREGALQSNRMNPPGIPMMYASSSATTAKLEVKATHAVRAGLWTTVRDARILDLRALRPIPGIFSDATRDDILSWRFLHQFTDAITSPVARDERVHIEYLPSQVATEFLRDFTFEGGLLDGIAYDSAVHPSGWNVALFADQSALCSSAEPASPFKWLRFERATRI